MQLGNPQSPAMLSPFLVYKYQRAGAVRRALRTAKIEQNDENGLPKET